MQAETDTLSLVGREGTLDKYQDMLLFYLLHHADHSSFIYQFLELNMLISDDTALF